MGTIFLSYSRKDIDTMQRIKQMLRGAGVSVWTDENLGAGDTCLDARDRE